MFRKLPSFLIKGLLFSIFLLFLASIYPSPSQSGSYDRLLELQRQIKQYEDTIKNLQGKEKSLNNEIAYYNNQIYLTELEIEAKETEIELLAGDIGNLSTRLERIASFLEFQERIFVVRARSAYTSAQLSAFDVVLGADSLDGVIRRIRYLRVLEEQDLGALEEMKETRTSFNDQKIILENKKSDVERLKKEVEDKKASLERQRADRAYLLSVTQNDEKRYQDLLAQTKSEVDSINKALRESGSPLGYKNAGDFIATQGASGCATGPHLHFEYRIGQYNPVNPLPYLNSGALKWPEVNPTITQYYGENAWIYKYYGYPQGHPGIDMQAQPSYGAPIFAAKSGNATLHSQSMYCFHLGRTVTGWGVKIAHGDGTYTLYWHIQPK